MQRTLVCGQLGAVAWNGRDLDAEDAGGSGLGGAEHREGGTQKHGDPAFRHESRLMLFM